MPQAGLAFQRLVLYCLHQALQLAGTPANLDLAVVDDGDPRRVIAAIFQPPQSLDDDRDGLLIADISNNSAHEISSENRFVVPPSGRKGRLQIHSAMPGACGLKAGLRTALFIIYGRRRRDMNDSCKSGVFDYRSSRVVCSVTSTIS